MGTKYIRQGSKSRFSVDVGASYDTLRWVQSCFGKDWFTYLELFKKLDRYEKGVEYNKVRMRLWNLYKSHWLDSTNKWQTLLKEGKIDSPGYRSDSRFFKLSKKAKSYLKKYGSFDNPNGTLIQDIKIKIAKQKGLLNQSDIIEFLESKGHEKEIEVIPGENTDYDCGIEGSERW